MNWEQYKNDFIQKNKIHKKFDENELSLKLNYAHNLYENNLPILYNVDHLSKVMGISKEYLYKVSNSNFKYFYRTFYLPKKNGGTRRIDTPLPNLKLVQKWIYENILLQLETSIYCKSYKPNFSIKDNAKFHRNQNLVLKLDIKNFFKNIRHKDIYLLFKETGYNNDICNLLTKLVILSNDTKIKNIGIAQGAITSPSISNLILKDFDNKIAEYCQQSKIRFTRYADDLTFSGDFNPNNIINFVEKNLKKQGFVLNKNKIRKIYKNESQIVTGIVVNEKLQVPRQYRKNIRLEIYHLLSHTKEHLNKKEVTNYFEQREYILTLMSKINFVLSINKNDKKMIEYKNKLYKLLRSLDGM